MSENECCDQRQILELTDFGYFVRMSGISNSETEETDVVNFNLYQRFSNKPPEEIIEGSIYKNGRISWKTEDL
jgi:hypothetical protein